MKLHLILLVSVFNLSSGFVAEVRGALSEETCTGDEFADFKGCVMKGVAADPNLAGFVDDEDAAFVNRGGERRLDLCAVCPQAAMFRGHWCFYVCGSTRRRGLEEGTDTPNLRRVQAEAATDTAVFEGETGAYTGNVEAISILRAMTTCLDDGFTHHPCLGTTDTMTMTVTL
jgi:hypothetical protein